MYRSFNWALMVLVACLINAENASHSRSHATQYAVSDVCQLTVLDWSFDPDLRRARVSRL